MQYQESESVMEPGDASAAGKSKRVLSPTSDAGGSKGRDLELPANDTGHEPDEADKSRELNLIRPARVRRDLATSDTTEPKRFASGVPSGGAAKAEPSPRVVEQYTRKRFVQDGSQFYFSDGRLAFRDHGRKLATASEDVAVIAALIERSCTSGWLEIELEGTERFRREAWRQGRLAGLTVRGYKPSAREHAMMIRVLASAKESLSASGARVASAASDTRPDVANPAGPSASETPMASGQVVVGKLVAHGLHARPSDPAQEISYFLYVETNEGERTIWGKDLQTALAQSVTQPKVGDEIAVRYAAPGSARAEACEPQNSWRVEKRDFFEARAKAAETLRNRAITPLEGSQRHPELVGSYFTVRAAELAAKDLRDLEDRKRFIEKVRDALADSIERGDPFPSVRLKQRPPGP